MKSLVAALLLFSLMLGVLVLNTRYLSRVTNELERCTEAIPSFTKGDEEWDAIRKAGLDRLASVWETERNKVSLSVTVRVTEGIDDAIGKMQAALRHGDRTEFDASREHLLRITDDLRRYDGITLGSIL